MIYRDEAHTLIPRRDHDTRTRPPQAPQPRQGEKRKDDGLRCEALQTQRPSAIGPHRGRLRPQRGSGQHGHDGRQEESVCALEEGNEPFTVLVVGVLVVRGGGVGNERRRRDDEVECGEGYGGSNMTATTRWGEDDGEGKPG